MESGGGGGRCVGPFLLATLGATALATALLCAAVMTRHWELVTWDPMRLQALAKANLSDSRRSSGQQVSLELYLDGAVTRISLTRRGAGEEEELASVFLVPVVGGIWTLCVDLTEEELRLLRNVGFPEVSCIDYLTPNPPVKVSEEQRPDWQHRMQNLSISCALVCLIILGCSALVGAFGVLKHQISAVLVTGVMYLLAATFALFTLTIIHFKRARSAECKVGEGRLGEGLVAGEGSRLDPSLWADFLPARSVATGWSLELGWAAAAAAALASALWILLAKVMRYNPLSHILT